MSEIASLADANIRSETYYVARARVRCRHCGSSTGVLALAVPHNHEILDEDTQDGGSSGELASDPWQRAAVNAILFHVERLPGDVQDRLNRISPFFRLAHSVATLNSYWANHCEHCGLLLDDHELHCEPDCGFMPSSEAAAANIQLQQIREPFEAVAAGYAFEPAFFGSMSKG
jgi:hypothetical protein